LEPSEDLRELERAILHQELPAVPASVARHNLPAPSTSLIGRERELEQVSGLLRNHRLVVLTGVGGSGKTRLAIEIALRQVGAWGDGVWLVDLTPLTDPALVTDAVAQILEAAGASASVDDLVQHTAGSELLLVLDNCEHLADACAEMTTALLRGSPHVRVLATSRVSLHVEGEVDFEVDPLLTSGENAPPDELRDAPAVRLFLERATAVRGGLEATPEHVEAAARICRELDGLPLAIELAAARAKAISLDQIESHLSDRFRFLSSWRRIVDPRHRTLEATMDWSYELLTEGERDLFCGLAVFAGQFNVPSAAGVCLEGDESRCLGLVESLVDASLVRATDDASSGVGMRYRLLETVREYAGQRLARSGHELELRRAHADYYLRLSDSAQLSTEATGEQRFEAVLFEQNNLRAAFDWALENGELTLGAKLAIALEQFWIANNPFEGMRWFEALGRVTELPPDLRARALLAHGGMAFMAGEFERSEQLYESALAAFRGLGEEAPAAEVLHRLANARLQRGETGEARALTMEALSIQRRLGDRRGEAVALGTLGTLASQEGDYDEAVGLLEQSAALAGETGFFWWQAHTLYQLGELAIEMGASERAEEHLRQALELAARIGERQLIIYSLAVLARTAAERGRLERAGLLWGAVEAEEQRQPVGQWEAERDEYAEPILAREGSVLAGGRDEGRRLALDDAVEVALRKP
jgi:non-specific serine/threonine protein kinase